ncbi:hypothetical protein Hypma_000018 [Hypsizygus marmoreus]|uniref:Uncharacterized protein n=1 Tax=Hypsizygus marmoreus TaxID=39966 RepID=A0A369KEF8_HYPMA|nr:hypothetical protein Hypma_000018 [Hypsizygus marmoreus]
MFSGSDLNSPQRTRRLAYVYVKDDQTTSLYLGAALLRAILMNHLAHSEASRNAKIIESQSKSKIEPTLPIYSTGTRLSDRMDRAELIESKFGHHARWSPTSDLANTPVDVACATI